MEFLESKYNVHFQRMLKKRRATKKAQWLNTTMRKSTFTKEIKKSQEIRDRYNKFAGTETARGLCYPLNFYENNYCPVILEEVCEPDVKKSKLFEAPKITRKSNLESEASDNSFLHKEKRHCVFLCHGYNGEASDMKHIYNTILNKDPGTFVYSCSTVEKNRKKGIIHLGEMIADEIMDEIEKVEEDAYPEKITLIGYSMGGLVLRAALPYLKKYKKRFHAFITLATPHIGYLSTENKLLTAGMWVAGTFNVNTTIAEIRMADSTKTEDCVLYKLSEHPGLEWFSTGKFK